MDAPRPGGHNGLPHTPGGIVRMRTIATLALLAIAATAAAPASADESVKRRLNAQDIKYTVDDDGDYRVIYNYSKEGRTQLVFVSGTTQSIAGFTIREVFSPAAKVDEDGVSGRQALELLEKSRQAKIGSWEIGGGILYFVIKLPDNVSAAQLEAAMDIVAEVADDMEIEISGDRDDL